VARRAEESVESGSEKKKKVVEEERRLETVATVVDAEGDGELSLRHPVTDSLLRVRGILVILYLKCFRIFEVLPQLSFSEVFLRLLFRPSLDCRKKQKKIGFTFL
jgi:hypothetical protein